MLDLNFLSETLLLAVKKQENYVLLLNEFTSCEQSALFFLKSDAQKKAFWINVYNAFYQILVQENPNKGKSIYRLKAVNIAGEWFSLDDIEHGILRKGKHKYSVGYFNSFFRQKSHKHLQPSVLDFRIHFALNCGAKSCPPITFYSPSNLNDKLNESTSNFLKLEININHKLKEMRVSKLFLWFRKDFGGRKGINRIVKNYLKVDVRGFKLRYAEYDWTNSLLNFSK